MKNSLIKNPLVGVPLRYGAAGGVLVIIGFVGLFFMGENPLLSLQMLDFLVLPIFIFFAIKDFRDNHNDKAMLFWQGMTVGIIVYVAVALLAGLFTLTFLTVCDCNLLSEFVTNRVEILESDKAKVIEEMGQATYDKALMEVKNTTAFVVSLDIFAKKCILGLLITIILSMIFRTKPKN